MDRLLKQYVKVFKALSDENRLKIVMLFFVKKELCVCEMQTLLNLSQSVVSRHLRILEEAGFLEARREGQWVIYQIKKENVFQYTLMEMMVKVLKNDKELQKLMDKAKRISLR